jgi:hypothetical protein
MPASRPPAPHLARRRFLLASGALTIGSLSGCASVGIGASGPPVEAPQYRVGDRWVYRARDGFRTPVVWDETHEVTAVGADAIHIRVVQRGPNVDNTREEVLAAPGLVRIGAVFDAETRRFRGTLERYAFPLQTGKSWNQWVDNYNDQLRRDGNINRYVRVGGWQTIATPAGSFEAIALNVVMHLDDDEFWRERTECTYLTWYAPAVRNVVRDEREAQYWEKGNRFDTSPVRSQHALLELASYTPGA